MVAQASTTNTRQVVPKLRVVFYAASGNPKMAVSTPWLRVEDGWLIAGTDTVNQQSKLAFFSVAGWEIGPGWEETGRRYAAFTVATETASGSPE